MVKSGILFWHAGFGFTLSYAVTTEGSSWGRIFETIWTLLFWPVVLGLYLKGG